MEAHPTVFVVDDEETIGHCLAMICKAEGLKVATYKSALRFLVDYDAQQAGCLVLDLQMSDMHGLELQKKLISQGRKIPIIFLSGRGDVSMAVQAMKQGAFDFIEKPFENEVLLSRIRQAISFDCRQRQEQAEAEALQRCFSTLTQREKQVMELIVNGRITKQIAHTLNISTKTVDFHRLHIMEKLGVQTIAELVQKALAIARSDLDKTQV